VAPAEVGYFVTAAYLGSMIGTATAGGWVERFGPIRVSQVGMLLCGCGLAIAASGALFAVLVGALLIGLGYGPATPASSVILARAAPPGMLALTFSIKQTGVPLGTAIAGAAVPILVLGLGWQGAKVDTRLQKAANQAIRQVLKSPGDPEAALAAIDPRKCQIVELRYFGGLSVDETAEVVGVSSVTVMREWRSAKGWLLRAISKSEQ